MFVQFSDIQTYKKPPPPAPEIQEPDTKPESFKAFWSFKIDCVIVSPVNFDFKYEYSSQISNGNSPKILIEIKFYEYFNTFNIKKI